MNYRRIILLIGIGMGLISSSLNAAQNPLEIKIKAAYLYNFTKFIDWPDRQSKTIRICVSGDPQVGSILEELSAKQNGNFTVISGTKINPAECHILYLSGTDTEVINGLNAAKEQNILTVSDNEHFSENGGIVTLFSENGKIRFEINLPAVRKTNLKISSKLLELAKQR
jgi:hypothetical protein